MSISNSKLTATLATIKATHDIDGGSSYLEANSHVKRASHESNHAVPTMLSYRKAIYVNLNNIRKMIKRLLTEKKMSKHDLALTLEITVKNLERLFSQDIPAALLAKVNMPLVKLYCSTKWELDG